LKFERANSEQIFTSNAASGNRKTWTFSAWIKRTELSQDYHTIFSCGYSNIQIMSNDRPRLILYNGSAEVYADPEMLLRDTAAWYHIVVQVDSTQSTASDRVKWYINGDRITNFNNSTYTNMSQDEDFDFGQAGSGSGNWLRLGEFFGGSEGFSGYMSDVYYLNGTAAQASDFGKYDSDSGIWIPKEYTGSGYGTQGFKYEFKDSSALGTDTSGEGHNANNLNNITSADQATDTPTNNFCTFNPLHTNYGDYIQGASTIKSTGNGWSSTISTIAPASGKWYVEFKFYDTGPAGMIGVSPVQSSNNLVTGHYGGTSGDNGVSWYDYDGSIRNNAVGVATYSTWGNSDIVAIALDLDNHKIYFAKNNTWQNSANPASGSNGISLLDTSSNFYIGASFYYNSPDYIYGNYGGYTAFTISSAASDENGYGTFEFAPPSGYLAICTKNLAENGG